MSGFEKKTGTQDIGLDSLCFCLSAVGWTALFGMVFGSGLDSPVLQAVLGWTALLEAFWVVGWTAQVKLGWWAGKPNRLGSRTVLQCLSSVELKLKWKALALRRADSICQQWMVVIKPKLLEDNQLQRGERASQPQLQTHMGRGHPPTKELVVVAAVSGGTTSGACGNLTTLRCPLMFGSTTWSFTASR